MDQERFGELIKGRIETARLDTEKEEAEQRALEEAKTNGTAALEEAKDMWRRCESFFNMLTPEDSIIGGDFHGSTEEPSTTLYNLSYRRLLDYQAVLLARNQEIEEIGQRNLIGIIMPDRYAGSSNVKGDFYLAIGIETEDEDDLIFPSLAQQHGTWMLKVGANALFEATGHKRNFIPGENYDYVWTPENVEAGQAYLKETRSELDSTLDWMLNAACDPELNPGIAEKAQAHRDQLQAAA